MTTNSSDDPGWFRLELLTTKPELHASLLAAIGALGVETQDEETFMEGADFAPLPDGKARLIAFFEARRPIDELRAHITDALDGAEIVELTDFDDRSWETAWMDYFKPISLSPRVTVGPPWDPPQPPPKGIALTIEPGMAFGTGTHETTRLCATMLDEILATKPVKDLLDVGCGSAILSMLAAGLGVPRVVGIDVDATAVDVARENIDKNGYSPQQIDLSTTPIQEISPQFDVVVANILANILLTLRDELLRTVAPGGDLILSGITDRQFKDFRREFQDPRFEEVQFSADGEWVALHLRRRE